MGKQKKTALSLFVSVLYGLGTMLFAFILMPRTVALPDPVWTALMLCVPAIAVIPLIKAPWYASPFCIFAGLPAQYPILYFNAELIAHRMGISLVGLPGFRYIFVAVTWPFFYIMEQFLVLYIAGKFKKKTP